MRSGRQGARTERTEVVTTGLLTKVLVGAVVLLFLVLSVSALIAYLGPDDDGDDGTEQVLQTFRDGSFEALVNASYDGATAYFEVPAGSHIEKATVKVSGSLPPQKRSYEAGRNPIYIASGDLDGDILPDLLVINNNDNNLMFMKNIGGTRFQKNAGIPVGLSPIKLLSASLDQDPFPDAVVLSEDTKDVHILLNDKFGSFMKLQAPIQFPKNPSDMVLLDMDQDGDLDIAVSTLNDDVVNLIRNDGSGTFTYASNITTEGNPTRLAVADIDKDGRDDLIVSNRQDTDSSYLHP